MSISFPCVPEKVPAAAFAFVGLLLALAPSAAEADGIHRRAQAVVPVYAQQAPPVTYYSAPSARPFAARLRSAWPVFSAPSTVVAASSTMYSAPSAVYSAPSAMYSAPSAVYSAPSAVYSAPSAVYSAPSAMYSAPSAMYSAPSAVYSAPTAVYSAPSTVTYQVQQAPVQQVQYQPFVGNAPGAVGNAPAGLAGSKIKPTDRADIIDELRKEHKESDKETSRRERRKSLKESANTKYKEAIGDDAELGDADMQDIDNIVNSIIDGPDAGQGANKAPREATGYGDGYIQATTYGQNFSAPGTRYVPVPGAPLIQPVVPVQYWVPVQPKHRLFHPH
jgi:hypothetical protein